MLITRDMKTNGMHKDLNDDERTEVAKAMCFLYTLIG